MWRLRNETLSNGTGLRIHVELDTKPATFINVLTGWQHDDKFRSIFNAWLADTSFSAFRWETPPVTTETLSQSFEFVLLDSPWLASCHPDADTFADYFNKSPQADVLALPNLGGDALMIVPCQKTNDTAYGHLAAFVREAPEAQRDRFWQMVAEAMLRRVNKTKPVWLSTAGGGVCWLHVRLDDRPKYYGYGPYRQLIRQSRGPVSK